MHITDYTRAVCNFRSRIKDVKSQNINLPYLVDLKSASSSFLQFSNPEGYVTRKLTWRCKIGHMNQLHGAFVEVFRKWPHTKKETAQASLQGNVLWPTKETRSSNVGRKVASLRSLSTSVAASASADGRWSDLSLKNPHVFVRDVRSTFPALHSICNPVTGVEEHMKFKTPRVYWLSRNTRHEFETKKFQKSKNLRAFLVTGQCMKNN